MFNKLTSRFFGSSNDRQIKKYKPVIDQINALEEELQGLSDDELKSKTFHFNSFWFPL